MHKTQLIALCACNVVIYTGLSGLVGLMPVYLTGLGADSTVTGFSLAFAYLSLAISTLVAGRLSDRFQHRKALLIAGGALAVPLTWLMGQATAVVSLLLLLCGLFFVTGTAMTMVTILSGLFSEPGARGRVFGILNLSAGLGLMLGALINGRIVDRWGYPALFILLALFYGLIPLFGLVVQDKVMPGARKTATPAIRSILTHRTFLFLFVASIVGQAANSLIFLSRTLIMDRLHFDATSISSAPAVGSLVTLPLPLIIGWLSDRTGRKPLLVGLFLTSTLGLLTLAAAVDLWQFWAASILQTGIGVSVVVGSAVITDLFPKRWLDASLSLFHMTPWIGIVVGLSGGGMAISALQMTPALMLGVLLSIVAVALLLPMSIGQPIPQPEAAERVTEG